MTLAATAEREQTRNIFLGVIGGGAGLALAVGLPLVLVGASTPEEVVQVDLGLGRGALTVRF